MKFETTFRDVLWQGDDQVIVRELLISLVPPDVQSVIVQRYNKHVSKFNKHPKNIARRERA